MDAVTCGHATCSMKATDTRQRLVRTLGWLWVSPVRGWRCPEHSER